MISHWFQTRVNDVLEASELLSKPIASIFCKSVVEYNGCSWCCVTFNAEHESIKFGEKESANWSSVEGMPVAAKCLRASQERFMGIRGQLITFIRDKVPQGLPLVFAGQGTTAHMAILAALFFSLQGGRMVRCITFGSPRIGNKTFVNMYNHIVPDTVRVELVSDLLVYWPHPLLWKHVGSSLRLNVHDATFEMGDVFDWTCFFTVFKSCLKIRSVSYYVVLRALNNRIYNNNGDVFDVEETTEEIE